MDSSAVSPALPSAVDAVVRSFARPPGSGQAAPPEQQQRQPSEAEFLAKRAVEEAPGGPRQTFARFVVDPNTHDVSVEILDATSQEVIRSIPNGDLRRMAQRYRASSGLVLDSAV
jgi:uncharacterized FlaG/YvyC family protein